MDPSEKKSLRLIEGLASCLRLNNFNDISPMLYTTYKYTIFIYQSVNIWEGYCLGRHLSEIDPEGTPNSARAAAEHL